MQLKVWHVVFVTLLFVVLCSMLIDSCKRKQSIYAASIALQDSVHVYRDKYGRAVSETSVLELRYSDLYKIYLKHTDSLKTLIGKNTITATKIVTVTKRDTVVISKTDTVPGAYFASWKNKWEDISITARPDSIRLQYTCFNKFDIIQEYRKQGLFKPKIPIVKVINQNPRTITTGVESFHLKPNKPGRGYWMLAGFAAGLYLGSASK